jgi:serine/threonine protein kinase
VAGTLITDRRTATATYKIIRRLGKGGMAEVFLAEQSGMAGMRRLAVLKKILPQFSEVSSVAAMLLDEARIAFQLNHPNIVAIYELGQDDGQYFIAMEYVDGCDLATLARIERHRQSRIPMRLTLRVVSEAAMGLDFAHRKKDPDGRPLNVIHRDVSPHNVMCSREGSVKVTDFGIAKAVNKEQVTEIGVVKGKVQYMAPEQYTGAELDHRADIYSLGVVLYQLTTGKLPRATKGGNLSMKRVIEGKIPLPRELRPDYPEELETIVMRALANSPNDRYPDCASLRDDLLDFARQHDMLAFPKELGDYVEELVPPFNADAAKEADSQIGRELSNKGVMPLGAAAAAEAMKPGVSGAAPDSDTVTFGTERVDTGAQPAKAAGAKPGESWAAEPAVQVRDSAIIGARDAGDGQARGDERAVLDNEELTPLPRHRKHRADGGKGGAKGGRGKPLYADDTGDDDPTVQRDDPPPPQDGQRDKRRERQAATVAQPGRSVAGRPPAADARRGPPRDLDRLPDDHALYDDAYADGPFEQGSRRAVRADRPAQFNPLLWGLGLLVMIGVGLAIYFAVYRGDTPTPKPRPGTTTQPKRSPAATAGTLDVIAKPRSATIDIDGARRCDGKTHCRIEALPLGTLLVTAKAPGYRIWNQRVVLTASKSALTLRPILIKETASAAAVDAGAAATAKKPAADAGTAKKPGKKPGVGSKPGKRKPPRRVGKKPTKPGKPKVRKPVKAGGKGAPPLPNAPLARGKGRVVKGKSGSKMALIVVDVRPAWAEVWVNGKMIGPTPIMRPIQPGRYRVDLRNPKLRFHVFYKLKIKAGDKIKIADTIRPPK